MPTISATQRVTFGSRGAFITWTGLATGDDGSTVEGLVLAAGVEATQQDVLEGTDTEKIATSESLGGLMQLRSISFASTLDIDFTGDTPAWAFENEIGCTGALTLRANTFAAHRVGMEFLVRCRRVSGSGVVTLADKSGGASVQYRDGLASDDIPALGGDAGDEVTIRAKVVSTSAWRVEAFETYSV